LTAGAIDSYIAGNFDIGNVVMQFVVAALIVLTFTYGQNITQVYISERVAKNLRTQIVKKVANLNYQTVQNFTSGRLLTNLTSDVDAVKMFISMTISSLFSAFVLLIGSAILLLSINWQLGLAVLAIFP